MPTGRELKVKVTGRTATAKAEGIVTQPVAFEHEAPKMNKC